jgi:hypothetical protein
MEVKMRVKNSPTLQFVILAMCGLLLIPMVYVTGSAVALHWRALDVRISPATIAATEYGFIIPLLGFLAALRGVLVARKGNSEPMSMWGFYSGIVITELLLLVVIAVLYIIPALAITYSI